MRTTRTHIVLSLLLWAGAAVTFVCAGTVQPPAEAFQGGNPVATMKTMNEVEPRIVITNLPMAITNAGSYYLVTSVSGTNGLFIDSDDVTIDLCGFGLTGDTNYVGVTHGIEIGEDVLNVTIKNGIIGDWTGWGIYSYTNADFFTVEDLTLELNGRGGMVLGPNCRVERVTVSECGGYGIKLGDAATVKDCKASNNTSNGIEVAEGATVVDCVASHNSAVGIRAEVYCTVKDCTVVGNQGAGILAHASCRILDNNVGNNGTLSSEAGIHMTGPGNQVKNNNITANGKGIWIEGSSNWLENNGVIDNDLGIELTGIGNFVIRNCIGTPENTNGVHLSIGSSNQVSQVLENLGGTFTNSNPWANIRLTQE